MMFDRHRYGIGNRGHKYLMQVIIALGDEVTSQVVEQALKAAPLRPTGMAVDPSTEFNVLPLVGEHAKPAVPKLLVNLHDQDHYTRARSAEMLGQLKLDAPQVVTAIIARLSDERAIVRARAAEALGRFGPEASSAVGPLQAAQDDSYLVVRAAARQSLSAIKATSVE